MKGQNLLESLGYIEEELIADADEEVALSVGMGWKRWTALAACMVLAVATVFMLITQHPFDDDVILMPTDGTIKSTNTTTTNTSDSLVVPPPDSPYPTKTTFPTMPQTSGITPSSTTRTHIFSMPIPSSTTTRQTASSTSVTTPTGSVSSTTPSQSTQPTIPTMGKDILDQLLGDYASAQTTQPSRTTAPQMTGSYPMSPPTVSPPPNDGDSPPPYIDRYIGTFGKAIAVRIGGEDTTYISVDQTVTVADITVHIPAGWPLWLYQDGQFRSISAAYEVGWITVADVEEIHRQLNF